MNARELRREAMRIGGELIHRDRVIEVFNPYTEQLIGTVPTTLPFQGLRTSIVRAPPTSSPAMRILACSVAP